MTATRAVLVSSIRRRPSPLLFNVKGNPMRKIVLMAVAAFLWKQFKARVAAPSTKTMGPSETYGGRR